MKDYKFTLLGENLLLHPYKSMYWERHKILFLSDLHLGKAAHFRKSGVPVPEAIHLPDLDKIRKLTLLYEPERIIFLGDLFHSSYNAAWINFKEFCRNELSIKPELIPGNHDILDYQQYEFLKLHVKKLKIEPFLLSHQPVEAGELNGYYNICGHLHPSVKITGSAKQSLRVACFYFGEKHGILPAFGSFTGTAKMPKNKSADKIFAVTNQKIIPLF